MENHLLQEKDNAVSRDTSSAKPKRGRGRPTFKPTDLHGDLVQAMIAHGISQERVARDLGISSPTLRKYFGRRIEDGFGQPDRNKLRLHLKRNVYGRNHAACSIVCAKFNAGWRPRTSQPEPSGL